MTFEVTEGFGKSFVGLTVYSDGKARLFVNGEIVTDDGAEATESVPLEDLQGAVLSLFAAYKAASDASEGSR